MVNGPGASDKAFLAKVSSTLAAVPGVDKTSLGTVPLTKDISFVTFKTTTSPQSEKTYQIVRQLRSSVLPPLYQGTANHIYTYGDTAINVDFAKVLTRKMPLFIAVVVGLSFLLLLHRVPQPGHSVDGGGDEPVGGRRVRSVCSSRSSNTAGDQTASARVPVRLSTPGYP